MGCFAVQKLFGRDPGSAETITDLFHAMLAPSPAAQCTRAVEIWLTRSQEFPTPADIIGIIRRKGKPPIKESEVIAIRKKDGADRTPEEWATLREWEKQQDEGWGTDFPDPVKEQSSAAEVTRLRQQVKELTNETKRLADLLHQARTAKGIEPQSPSMAEKVAATIEAMRKGGAPEEDIAAFVASQGVAA